MAPSPRAIIHLDMDAFYASVEQRDRPELRGRPVIVGGHAQRGVVLAASYEVRPLGVRSAMSMARALQLAPDAVVVRPRPAAYAAASAAVFALLEQATPLVEPLSLDEAFLDVTASVRLLGPPARIAADLRRRIAAEVGLPASAGIADVKMAAKIASDLAKPNGQREVALGTTRAFLAPLPISRLWGVGPKTERALRALGISRIGELARAGAGLLERRLGASAAAHLAELARGEDPRPVVPDRAAKSIGAEDTFDEDLDGASGLAALRVHIHAQALRVGQRLRAAGARARAVQLKLKLADFTLRTRRTTLPSPTDDGQTLYRAAAALLDREPLPNPVRLTGVSAQDLIDVSARAPAGQLTLVSPAETAPDPRARLNATLDHITRRFGATAITTADIAGADPEEEEREG